MSDKKIQIGGQAVIEGVMMRGPEQIATAMRRKDGSVDLKVQPFVSLTQTHPVWKLPIIRGFVSLIEMLKIGIQTLNLSVDRAMKDGETSEDGEQTSEDRPQTSLAQRIFDYLAIPIALILAFALFGYLPYLLASLLKLGKQHILFNLFAGSIRIVFFVVYVYLVSLMKDVRRVFEYHGAEHKSVFAHEQRVALTVDNVRPFTTIHPRCGTSFMFLVLLIAILVFSIIDTLVVRFFYLPNGAESPNALVRLLYHLPFMPLISGISYEVLKLSAKRPNHILVKIFTAPGMALQNITTRTPDDQQIETAIIALKAAINEDLSDYPNISYLD